MKTKKINMKMLIILICSLFFNNCKKQINDADYTISIDNKTINIELEANWSTGYSWYWGNKDAMNIVDTLKREYIEDTSRRGAPGKEIWTFVGKNKGEGKIILLYKRSVNDSIFENKKEFLIKVE